MKFFLSLLSYRFNYMSNLVIFFISSFLLLISFCVKELIFSVPNVSTEKDACYCTIYHRFFIFSKEISPVDSRYPMGPPKRIPCPVGSFTFSRGIAGQRNVSVLLNKMFFPVFPFFNY